jgi:hypothetical protein
VQPINSQEERPIPDYVVAVTKVGDNGDTAPVGDEIPIANSGYELKRGSPSQIYQVVKVDQ